MRSTTKTSRGLLSLVGALLCASVLAPAAQAETAPPRTEVAVRILADSTAPDDPSDGVIPTYDVARYRVDVSQNGAASTGPVTVDLKLTNGAFVDRDPATEAFDLPTRCGAASSVSSDRTAMACVLGPLEQGTSLAFEYLATPAGEGLANGDRLGAAVTVAGKSAEAAPLTIEGSPYVDVAKSKFIVDGAANGSYVFRYALQVRPVGPTGKGGLPLSSVTFTEDWSEALAEFPGATLELLPQGSGAGLVTEGGSWAITTGSTPGTSKITVTNLGAPDADGFAAGAIVGLKIPVSEAPVGTRVPFTNRVTNVTGAASDATVANETVLDNNAVDSEIFRQVLAGGINGSSAWIGSSSAPLSTPGFSTELFKPVEGNTFQYTRGFGGPESVSSTGQQRAYPGQSVIAEAAASMNRSLVDSTRTKLAACAKFTTPVTAAADATATAMGSWSGPGPSLSEVDHLTSATPVIYYSSNASTSASANCTDGTWTTSRPATVTAVRAVIDVSTAKAELDARNWNPGVVVRLPITVPALDPGDLVRFHNLAVAGDWTNSASITAADIANIAGTVAPDIYDSTANTGNPRYGDRLVIGKGWVDADKTVCDSPAGTYTATASSTVDYCLVGRFEGAAPVTGVTFVDDGGLGLADAPIAYKAGSATVKVGNAPATAITATIDAATGKLTFPVGTVALAGGKTTTVTVRFTANVQPDADPGSEHRNTLAIESADLPPITVNTGVASNPQLDDQVVVLAASAAQLQVTKSTTSPGLVLPGSNIPWDLHLTNQGPTTIGTLDVIDVLPYNGDGPGQDRVPPSNFHGTVGLTGAVTATGTVTYASAAPDSVSSLPLDPTNQAGGATTWCTASAFGDPGCPADFDSVTAIRVVDTADLLPGATRSITVPMGTDANRADDVYTNDTGAAVQQGAAGPWLPVRSNDVTVTVATPGLGIVKTTEDQAFTPGTENTYTLTVTNDGKLAEPAAVVTDQLREGLEFVSASDSGAYDAATHTVTWPAKAIAAGDSFTYTVTIRVPRPAPASIVDETGLVPNSAKVTGTGDCIPGVNEDENCESTVTNETAEPQLRQDKVVDKTKSVPGGKLVYTVKVTNVGDATATDVVALDELPDEVTVAADGVDVDQGDTQVLTNSIVWNIGTLEPAQTVTMTAEATINAGEWDTSFVNKVKATHSTDDCIGDCLPPVVDDPCEDDGTKSCAPTNTPKPSLRQDKTVDKTNARPGDVLTYTLTVSNPSTVAGKPAKAVDELPEKVTYVSGSASNGGVYDAEARTVTWTNLPVIAPGKSIKLTLKAKVNNDAWSTSFVNEFKVTPPPTWPPTVVDHQCTDDATKSCAPTKTPPKPVAKSPAPPATGTTTIVRTGGDVLSLVALALALIGCGAALFVVGRRRRMGGAL